jgi:four helix bundle protein
MITKFEDLIVWQKARILVCEINQYTLKPKFSKDFNLKDQIIRSSRSIMSNIAEGFGRHTFRDYKQFIVIARGSLTETQNHLYIAFDLNYLTQEEFDNLYRIMTEIHKLLNGLINHLSNKNKS